VIDTSTVGIAAARATDLLLAEQQVVFIDAPVSGGVAGARARTLAVMYAGADEACAHVRPVLAGLSDRLYRVGDQPGMGQALKLANNFLSATHWRPPARRLPSAVRWASRWPPCSKS
jgi:3-hydroxyisobutyrate dehydrogenase-like beta-hydroxyacid dehydrogenase